MKKEIKTQIAVYLWLILCFRAIRGVPPPGLTSLKKCNKYYNLGVPETDFTPLTKQELDTISRDEWNYPPFYAIAGGQFASPKQFPFMAALGYDNGDQKEFVCGGTLISEEFVLTAAHCVYSKSWGKVKYIRMGHLNLSSSIDNIGVQEFQLKEVYVHPNYRYPVKYHDIALIKVDGPVKFSEYVSPACLEPKRKDVIHTLFYIAGWGHLGYGEDPSDHLQFGIIRHNPDIKCQKAFTSEHTLPEGVKPQSQICAADRRYLTDTCEGDSGGPLAYSYDLSNTVFMIAGITSFGKACGSDDIPAVYTRVSYYTDWIERTVWPNEFIALDPHRIYFPDT